MKPANVLIWHAIRRFGTFDCAAVAEETGIKLSVVQGFVSDLSQMGYLAVVGESLAERIKYRKIKDSILVPFGCRAKRTGRDRCWVAIRVMRQFTIADLCKTAGASEAVAHTLVFKLSRVGVLKSSFRIYRLIVDLGVGTPILMADGRVLDVNTGKFLEIKGVQEDGI